MKGQEADAEQRLPKGWLEAAASLLGPVGPRAQLTSAFSEALAARAGEFRMPNVVLVWPVVWLQYKGER